MRRVSSAILSVGLLALGPAPAALGQKAVQRSDPEATSPAGVIYEIPLDAARGDGAPHPVPGESSGGIGVSNGASPARRGASGSRGGAGGTAEAPTSAPTDKPTGATAAGSKDRPEPGSSIHSENGFGSSSQVPGVTSNVVDPAGDPSGDGLTGRDPSGFGTLSLLGLIGLLSAWVGVTAARGARRRRTGDPDAGP